MHFECSVRQNSIKDCDAFYLSLSVVVSLHHIRSRRTVKAKDE